MIRSGAWIVLFYGGGLCMLLLWFGLQPVPRTPSAGGQVHAGLPFVYHDTQSRQGEWLTCLSSRGGTLFPPLLH